MAPSFALRDFIEPYITQARETRRATRTPPDYNIWGRFLFLGGLAATLNSLGFDERRTTGPAAEVREWGLT